LALRFLWQTQLHVSEQTQPMRMLLVEDDHLLARTMLDMLREDQNTVDWLDDGQQALNALSTEHFDLVILDLTLPRVDGLDIVRRSRQQGNLTPIIILTARTDLDEKLQGLDAGFWIRTAQREDIRQELSQELALGNVLPLLLALPLLVAAAIAAIQFSFRPLRRLEKPVRNMAPERIHPLDDRQAPKEVAGLVQAVNGLLKRLNQALERERRFSADAAHEL